MNKQLEIKTHIGQIIAETKTYDFPIWSDEKGKYQIISRKKAHIENSLKQVSSGYWPDNDQIEKLWNQSIEYANNQFSSLPPNIRINGFYLQELMHYYAKQLGNFIMQACEVK